MRWINRFGTAVIAVLFIAGPPVAVGWWLTARGGRLPTVAYLRSWAQQPPGTGMIAVFLGCIAVSGWLLLAYAVVRRAWHTIARATRRWRRMPLPTPAQMTAGSMAGVAVLAMPAAVVQHPSGATSVSSAAEPAPAGAEAATVRTGIELPGGGWVPYRTALAVTVLSGAIWLHRRQHYQPRPPRYGQHRDDADLQPLPATADAIIAATEPAEPASTAPARADAALTDFALTGTARGSTLLPQLPDGLLVLHGPGAADAVRGLLVTNILDTALANGLRTTVTMRPGDLTVLADVPTAGAVPPGVRCDEATVGDALRRHGVNDDGLHGPAMVLSRPDGPDAPAVRGAGQTVVVLDDNLHTGRRWFVAADGHISGTGTGPAQRLCLLDRQAATDLLLLVRHHASATARATPPAGHVDPHAEQPRPVQLQLLGGCQLHVGGQAVTIRRSAGLQVLAYLAVHPDGATTTELIRAIWPGLDPNTITKRLHTTLTDLRQQVQPLDVIVRRDERYRLNTDAVDTDLSQLRQALVTTTAAVADQQRQTAAQTLLDTYRGELAAGYTWPWVQRPREAIRRDVIDAYLHLAATADPEQALDLVHAAVTADPCNEAIRAQAQPILAAAGEHSENRSLPDRLS